ncbi:short chain dehydrogenase, putative [Bodo saltans]|uniref:Short chain dehydrogenase, putative n=1 Tax=Bodo saltans TaxID=75058 RepID=A0A0S4IP03_BODSA|nr:short chain dehydrogenase, putative [Bodo saltans]|eukprot:CUF76326.1 short chain dehydrogenase, putative [Bodo saltans]
MSASRPVAIVTGATGTFGEYISLGMLRAGYNTICVGRNAEKGAAFIARLKAELAKDAANTHTTTGEPTFAAIDCSSLSSIEAFARTWAEKQSAAPAIHVLVNNAAIVPDRREVSADGVELQWAANVLGYDWMIRSLLPFLKLSAVAGGGGGEGRVVNVASHYAGDLDLSDVEFTKRTYNANTAYRQSKQANRMLAKLWGDKLAKDNIVVTSCHPGVADSSVLSGLGFTGGGDKSGKRGSETPLYCALTQKLTPGGFYAEKKLKSCPFASDSAQVSKLGGLLEQYAVSAAASKR